MTKVEIFGPLADHLKQTRWSFVLSSIHEVFQALEANTGKLVSFFSNNPELEYRVIVNGTDIFTPHALFAQGIQLDSIVLVPSVRASGNAGMWFALLGLVIVGLVLAIPTGGASTGFAALMAGNLGTGASFALTMGVALTFAGVTQLIYGSQKAETLERPDSRPSDIFNGAVNTYSQGNPVPVGFGRMRIGSQVISVGIRSIDITEYASE